eukprot:351880-Chlamydomonas_euryale.AAC.2
MVDGQASSRRLTDEVTNSWLTVKSRAAGVRQSREQVACGHAANSWLPTKPRAAGRRREQLADAKAASNRLTVKVRAADGWRCGAAAKRRCWNVGIQWDAWAAVVAWSCEDRMRLDWRRRIAWRSSSGRRRSSNSAPNPNHTTQPPACPVTRRPAQSPADPPTQPHVKR